MHEEKSEITQYKMGFMFKSLIGVGLRFILAIVFFIMVTPVGFLLRFLGVDFLKRKIDKNVTTYWIKKS